MNDYLPIHYKYIDAYHFLKLEAIRIERDDLRKLVHKLADEFIASEISKKELIKYIDKFEYYHNQSFDNFLKIHKRLESQLDLYKQTINKIDDYFEYSNESGKDRDFIWHKLGRLTQDLKQIKL